MSNNIVYTFTPEQVKKVVETLMQFPADKVYDTIRILHNEIDKQNADHAKLVAAENAQ